MKDGSGGALGGVEASMASRYCLSLSRGDGSRPRSEERLSHVVEPAVNFVPVILVVVVMIVMVGRAAAVPRRRDERGEEEEEEEEEVLLTAYNK